MLTAPIRINRFGLKFYLGFENIHYLFQSNQKMCLEPHFRRLPTYGSKLKIWDIGANIGFFTVQAASWGHSVVAFELSPRACRILRKNLRVNNLNAQVVEKPLTLKTEYYHPPKTAHQENKLTPGFYSSLSWKSAVTNFGTPDIIKMDIEGKEEDFLCNDAFSRWIFDNDITLFVECHGQSFTYTNLTPDLHHPNHLIHEGKAIRNIV